MVDSGFSDRLCFLGGESLELGSVVVSASRGEFFRLFIFVSYLLIENTRVSGVFVCSRLPHT
jgi:hypothetical protein